MDWTIEELADTQNAPLDLLLDADPSEDMVREYLKNGKCLIARQDGRIAGILVYMRTRPLTAEIMIVSVREEFRNRGIARSLILRAIERARLEKYAVIEIGTGNPGALQMLLYQKCGFRIVGVDLDYFRRNHKERIFENGIECRDMIRMRMEL
jgi:ribosomal protein S18 acetylase RimI-like enzyme